MNNEVAIIDLDNHYLNLSIIFNGVTDALFLIKVEYKESFRVIEINRPYLEVTGFQREELINKKVEEILSGEAVEFVIKPNKVTFPSRNDLKIR